MTELLANISFGAMMAVGLLLIGGFMLVAVMNEPRNALHPEGRMGRLRDEVLALAGFSPMLAMVTFGAFADDFRDREWWTPVFFGLAGLGFVSMFLPAVRRARGRLAALRSDPPQ